MPQRATYGSQESENMIALFVKDEALLVKPKSFPGQVIYFKRFNQVKAKSTKHQN